MCLHVAIYSSSTQRIGGYGPTGALMFQIPACPVLLEALFLIALQVLRSANPAV